MSSDRAAPVHCLLELLPLLLQVHLLDVRPAAALVAPAYRILAEVEVVEVLDRVEPVPLTTGVVRVRAAHVGTRAPLWPALPRHCPEGSRPASAQASLAATRASWLERSRRRAWGRLLISLGRSF